MNAQTVQGSWNQIRGKVKEKWSNLTDDDLMFREGGLDKVIGKIQQRTGEARESIEKYLTDLTADGAGGVSKVAEKVGQAAHQATDRIREHWSQVNDQAGEGYEYAQQVVRRNPAQSVAAVFGVGLGIGLLIGLSLRGR